MDSNTTLCTLWAQQAYNEQLADAVQDRLSTKEWDALIAFNQYCAGRLGLTLEFYRIPNGVPSYRFRPWTEDEQIDRISDRIEDQL